MPDSASSHLHPLPLAPLAARLRDADEGALQDAVSELLSRAAEHEPAIRALLPEDGRPERLQAEVSALCERWPDPQARPPLFGIPVGVKDIIAVDGLPTRAGSALPAEEFEMPEASIVSRLEGAGALVFGKTVTTEFASSPPGGTTNPHDPAHTPGGSSSGSAAGVAAGYFPLALGTQTGGSVIRPAAFCGITGFKPSYGRIPFDGVLTYAASVDTLGLFTQDLAGIALAAPAVVDDWREVPARTATDVTLVIPDGPYLELASPEGLHPFEETLAALSTAGVNVLRRPFLDDLEDVIHRHGRMMDAEFAAGHKERFSRWGPIYSGPGAQKVDRGREVTPEQLERGREGRLELRARVTAFLDEVGADAIACPSALGPAPVGLASTGDARMNYPWTHAGVPAVTLPAGIVGRLPVGLQLVGRYGADEELLGVAAALERMVARD